MQFKSAIIENSKKTILISGEKKIYNLLLLFVQHKMNKIHNK